MIRLRFDKGTLLLKGSHRIPYSSWDPNVKGFRALALHYKDVLSYMERSGFEYIDSVLNPPPCPELRYTIELRKYQIEALEAWETCGNWGVIVLHTGSGKTYIAIAAIATLNKPALIVVPTLNLLAQWRKLLSECFQVDIGVFGGGDAVLRALTVSTYDSAYLRVAS